MVRRRIATAMPMIALLLLLFSGFVLEDWLLGVSFFLLVPISWILLGKNVLQSINRAMPMIALALFLWIALGTGNAHPAWVVFLLIPLSDAIFNRRFNARRAVVFTITAVYLVLGFTIDDFWHPGWLMFLLIPIINTLFFPNTRTFVFMSRDDIKSRVRAFVEEREWQEDDDEDWF